MSEDEEDKKCTCAEETEDHTCPYQEEINEDYESMCSCCEECEYQCSMDI